MSRNIFGKLQYHPDMSPEEEADFMREQDELDAQYAAADAFDKAQPLETDEEFENEWEFIRGALNRGRP